MNLKQYISGEKGRATFLAKKLGVTLSYISQMASGDAAMSAKTAVKIEEITEREFLRIHQFHDWKKIWPELKE
ncbi:transcriptional regulator [Undibacterium sp. SXout20W]|uniref:transcriptional regulator n=1 Tax=Undibacterium sp. SXout20W TaxID=3413051 RepID=UPI003BF096A5